MKPSILKMKHPIADGSKAFVMGNDYRCQLLRSVNLLEQAMNAFTRLAVQVTGWLICQKQARPGYKCSCQRNPGLLTAGQLSGSVRNAIGEADTFEH